jgi:hypothetical protein
MAVHGLHQRVQFVKLHQYLRHCVASYVPCNDEGHCRHVHDHQAAALTGSCSVLTGS